MIHRFEFLFYVRTITREVEIPDGVEEGSDEYERILQRAAGAICVDDYVEWEDAWLDE